MEKLYKSRSEICLSQVKETLWEKPPPKQCRWRKILPGSLKSKWLVPHSPQELRCLMNTNLNRLLSSQEGDLWLRECAMFKRPSWHKKHFVLLEDRLYCYENKKGVLAFSEIVMMSDITSLTLQDSNCIKVCHADGSTRLLRCPSVDVRNTWLTALLAAKAANLLKYQ